MTKKIMITILCLIVVVTIVIVLKQGGEKKQNPTENVVTTTTVNDDVTDVGNEGGNILEGVDLTTIEKAEVYLVAEWITLTEQSKIKKLTDYLQAIQLGEENKTFDRYGTLGGIYLYDKNGAILRMSLVGTPYVSVHRSNSHGVYKVQQYNGGKEYDEDFKKLFKKLKNGKL